MSAFSKAWLFLKEWPFDASVEEKCLMFHDGLCSRADCSRCTKQEKE